MPNILDPIYCPIFIPTSLSAQYMQVSLPNNTNLAAIRICNKGAFDVKYNGFGCPGQDWILAGESVCYSSEISNTGYMQFLSYASNANSDSRYYDVSWRSTLIVTLYTFGELIDYTRRMIPIYGPTPDLRILNAPSCQGTTVSVPLSTGTFAPFTNTTLLYLLGFDVTIGPGAAAAGADLIVQNLSGQHGQSNALNYMLNNNRDYVLRYPRNGLANFTGSPIQLVVPNLSTSVIDVCVYYSYNTDMTI